MQVRDKDADMFYAKLFELDQSLMPLFTGNIAEQGIRLLQMLEKVVQKINRLDELLPELCELAERHAAYRATHCNYETVGTAFLSTLKTSLGDTFTPDLAAAWEAVYMALSHAIGHDVRKSI